MNKKPENILVVHCEGIGDSVLSLPFLSLLPVCYPQANLRLIVGQARKEIYDGLKEYTVIETDEHHTIRCLLRIQYDIVYDLNCGPRHVTEFFKAIKLDYCTYVGFEKAKRIRGEISVPNRDGVPRWREYLDFILLLNEHISLTGRYECTTSQQSKKLCSDLVGQDVTVPLICVAPGASSNQEKCWPSRRFAEVIEHLREIMNCRVILLGSDKERETGDKIEELVGEEVENFIGLTTIGSAMEIISRAVFVLANDNGLLHLAGLLNVPSLGLYGPTDPVKWKPLGVSSGSIRSESNLISDIPSDIVKDMCQELLLETHNKGLFEMPLLKQL